MGTFMKWFATLLLLVPSAALAQSAPYKLVIIWGGGAIAVTDYPSAPRCEHGRQAVYAEIERKMVDFRKMYPGAQPVGPPTAGAFCIPG
jgi:hypothetical protein